MTRDRISILQAALLLFATASPRLVDAQDTLVTLHPRDDLAAAVAAAPPGGGVRLLPGVYELEPSDYTDPTCGNCEDPAQPIPATLGLRLAGRGLRLVGAGADSTTVRTHAGYGILVEDCDDCLIEGLTITGGVRDPEGNATDAAIVVRRSTLEVRACRIADNIGDAAVIEEIIVGIIGIAGREGADITIVDNEILRNSWDGIALYRDARATIRNTVIDGVDRARGRTAGGGRGVGIGVTWNARADIQGNLVRNYWKGIGTFVDAQTTIRENVVEEVLTWGLSLWDAGRGAPSAIIEHNAIFRTGACGVAVVRDSTGAPPPGRLVGNAFVETGQDPKYDSGEPYCFQTAIARHAVPPDFEIRDNLLVDNREPDDRPGAADVTDPALIARAVDALCDRLAGWSALGRSSFMRRCE